MIFPIRDFEVSIEQIPVNQRNKKLISDFVRKQTEIFANSPYNQYLMHKSDLNCYISPEEIFGTKDYLSFEQLYSHQHNDEYIFCDNLHIAERINAEKLAIPDSTFVLIQRTDTGEIMGGAFTYRCKLEKAYKDYEEWENPLLFSGMNLKPATRDFELFRNVFQNELQDFDIDNHDVLVMSSIFLTPSLRNYYSLIFQLLFCVIKHMPNEKIPLVLEMIENSTISRVFGPLNLIKIDFMLDHDSKKYLYYHSDFAKCKQDFSCSYSRFLNRHSEIHA